MKVKSRLPVLFTVFLLFIHCAENIEDPDPPSVPVWVQKSLPEDTLETGIDADPIGNRIILQWYRSPEPDIEGIIIYRAAESRGDSISGFDELARLNIYESGSNDTVFFDEDVELGTNYHYYLRAFDHARNRSKPSDTLRYELIEKADLIYPVQGDTASTKPEFAWLSDYRKANEFVIRVESFPDLKIVWISRFPSTNYTGDVHTITYNNDGKAGIPGLGAGIQYRWRIDTISMVNPDNTEWAGSESEWQYFRVKE